MPDDDIWFAINKLMQSKELTSIALSKVKGNTTSLDVQNGIAIVDVAILNAHTQSRACTLRLILLLGTNQVNQRK